MPRFTNLPTELPDSLAQRIQCLREHLDLTQRQLAQKAYVTENFIQDLESGMEVFLAPAVRLKLARALRIRPSVLQDVEKRPEPQESGAESEAWQKNRRLRQLLEHVLQNPNGQYHCLDCNSPLMIRQFHRRDLQDNPLLTVKIECSQCLFRWSTD